MRLDKLNSEKGRDYYGQKQNKGYKFRPDERENSEAGRYKADIKRRL